MARSKYPLRRRISEIFTTVGLWIAGAFVALVCLALSVIAAGIAFAVTYFAADAASLVEWLKIGLAGIVGLAILVIVGMITSHWGILLWQEEATTRYGLQGRWNKIPKSEIVQVR